MPTLPLLYSHLLLAPCAASAANHLARHHHSFSHPERLWCFYYGTQPTKAQIFSLGPALNRTKIILLYDDDLLGKVAAIKIACWVKGKDVQIHYTKGEMIRAGFNGKTYHFSEFELSLNRFEKRTGLRSRIKTYRIQVIDLTEAKY